MIQSAIDYPFYVYEIRHPTTNNVLYVGKGSFDRKNQHVKEAIHSKMASSEKLAALKKILDENKEATILTIGRYKTEKEAFAVEATLIHWVYGTEILTNAQSGHGSLLIRPQGNLEKIDTLDAYDEINLQQARNEVAQRDKKLRELYNGLKENEKLCKEHIDEPVNSGSKNRYIAIRIDETFSLRIYLGQSLLKTTITLWLASKPGTLTESLLSSAGYFGTKINANGLFQLESWRGKKLDLTDFEEINQSLVEAKAFINEIQR